MSQIYAYLKDGPANGEVHTVGARVDKGLSIPPEGLAVDKAIYKLVDYLKGTPDSYIYVYDPKGNEDDFK